MNQKEAEFFAELLNTFKIEAEEHLKSISNGLVALEGKLSPKKQKEWIEVIYRESHSLKGAARSVNLDVIQTICQSLENVLSDWKDDKIKPTKALFNAIYATVDLIGKFVSDTEGKHLEEEAQLAPLVQKLETFRSGGELLSSEPPQTIQQVEPRLEEKQLSKFIKQKKESPRKRENGKVRSSKVSRTKGLAIKLQGGLESDSHSEQAPAPAAISTTPEMSSTADAASTVTSKIIHDKGKTIRITSSKLDKLLQHVEEMLMIKITSNQHYTDLKNIQGLTQQWHKEWAKVQTDLNLFRLNYETATKRKEDIRELNISTQLFDYLAWQDRFLKSFKDLLVKVTKKAAQDYRVAGGMIDTLLDETKKVLMQPFSSLLEVLPRMVRDIAEKLGKEVKLEFSGEEIEIDRRILEEMKDPLIHLVRNSIDHGLESPEDRLIAKKTREGLLKISVSELSGNNIELVISDDGSGIDLQKLKKTAYKMGRISAKEVESLSDEEAIKLIFQSGISTSPIITELSGRGLGLGIVAEKVEKLGGKIYVESQPHLGTTFRILLPSTLATFRGIHIGVRDHHFILPTRNVLRIFKVGFEEIKTIENRTTITVEGKTLAFVQLADTLQIPVKAEVEKEEEKAKYQLVLIVGSTETQVAFGIDNVFNEQEVFVKPLGKQLARVKNIAAATVLEQGKIVPILNPFDLIKSVILFPSSKVKQTPHQEKKKIPSILVVEDSVTARMLLKNILESAGYTVKTAVDGVDAFEALIKEEVDLLLSDIEMPRMDGLELAKKVRISEKFKNLPIVLCTSRGSKEDREHGIAIGANAYIDKSSFAQSSLLDIIQKLL